MKKALLLLFVFAFAFLALAPLEAQTAPQQVARGSGGAAAAEEQNAARAGIEILKRGGNAADAAVAMALALAVTWPEAGNLGGGGFWISRDERGRVLVIDFREVAPREARPDLFVRPGRDGRVPSSTDGPLASGVPGSVAGLALAHRRAGRLPWKDVVGPAFLLARDGFAMTENIAQSIAAHRDDLAGDPEAAAIFLPSGAPPEPGVLFRQPALAKTLEAIRDRGADGFYRGRVAREIEAGQKRQGGLIDKGDLARYTARERAPIRFRFGDADVVTTPAPSSGAALAEMALLATAVGPERLRRQSADAMHWTAEIEKRVYHDRNRWLGDPAWRGVRERDMLDPDRVRRIAASIDPALATPSASWAAAQREHPSTTHFSVADARGAVVSVTTTLNDSFGNGRVAPGLGFLWNNEMDDFAAKPGQPNMYGLVEGAVNAVAPGKRMLSSMCPTIAVLPGRGVFAWGTPGGSTIVTTNFQVLLGLALRGQSLADAVAAPRFHQQDFQDILEVERGGFDPAWVAALEAMGHAVKVSTRTPVPGLLGRVHAVSVEPGGGTSAVADPRRGGAALAARPAP
ncbi:MAG: gamma-glutamyltransferase [Thermoanaerobaculia bacterium]